MREVASIDGWSVPDGATDTHAHVFGPFDRFALNPERNYTPPPALAADYRAALERVGCSRAVIVQPSVYGTDNRCTLAAARELGLPCRVVVALDPAVPLNGLPELHAQGVRGVRVNFRSAAITPRYVETLAAAIAPLGWHLQFYVDATSLVTLLPFVGSLAIDCVVDHMGMVAVREALASPAIDALLASLAGGRTWVKLSAPYRVSDDEPLHADCAPLVRALYSAAPDRCVWGSDWPHPRVGRLPDIRDLFVATCRWLDDEDAIRRVFVDNPAKLYGFAEAGVAP